jgi:hypothetical protein
MNTDLAQLQAWLNAGEEEMRSAQLSRNSHVIPEILAEGIIQPITLSDD